MKTILPAIALAIIVAGLTVLAVRAWDTECMLQEQAAERHLYYLAAGGAE